MQYITLDKNGKISALADWQFPDSVPAQEEVVRTEEGQFVFKSELDLTHEEYVRTERKKAEVRAKRNELLAETDKFLLEDFPIDKSTKDQYKAYRQYLRDYPSNENWYLMEPKTFDDYVK